MAGSGPHQTSPQQAESANVRQQDEFLNLERERDRENYQVENYQVAVYILSMQVEAIFEGEATSPMSEMIIKPCNERLTT